MCEMCVAECVKASAGAPWLRLNDEVIAQAGQAAEEALVRGRSRRALERPHRSPRQGAHQQASVAAVHVHPHGHAPAKHHREVAAPACATPSPTRTHARTHARTHRSWPPQGGAPQPSRHTHRPPGTRCSGRRQARPRPGPGPEPPARAAPAWRSRGRSAPGRYRRPHRAHAVLAALRGALFGRHGRPGVAGWLRAPAEARSTSARVRSPSLQPTSSSATELASSFSKRCRARRDSCGPTHHTRGAVAMRCVHARRSTRPWPR